MQEENFHFHLQQRQPADSREFNSSVIKSNKIKWLTLLDRKMFYYTLIISINWMNKVRSYCSSWFWLPHHSTSICKSTWEHHAHFSKYTSMRYLFRIWNLRIIIKSDIQEHLWGNGIYCLVLDTMHSSLTIYNLPHDRAQYSLSPAVGPVSRSQRFG